MKTQNDALHELSLDRITIDEYEAFQIHERNVMRNNIHFVIMLAINTMLFLIACMSWYLAARNTITWYDAAILHIVFGFIGWMQTIHYFENRI